MSTENLPLRHAFNARQRVILNALFDRMFASDNPSDTTPSQVDLAGRFSHWLSEGDPMARVGFKLVLWFCNWLAPLFFLGRPRRFVSLRPEHKDRIIERWLNLGIYPLRMVLFGIYMTGSIVYFDLEEVKSDMGFDSRCLADAASEGAQ